MKEDSITRRNLWFFPLGTVGRDMVYNLITSFLMLFVLYTKGLNASQLGVITVIMIAARVFDALNDPIMGNIIERTRTRWGKFKPWLVIGIVTTSIVIYLTFNVRLRGWPFVIFFGVMYFLYSITYTMHDISYWGMVPALSSNADTRNKFTARATLFAGIGGLTASVLIPMLTNGEHAIGGNAITAYGVIALVIAILAPAFLAITVIGVKEQRDSSVEPVPPVSFKKIWSTITGNDQLLWISLILLIQQIGNGIVLSGVGMNYIYMEFGYEGGFFSLFQIVGMAVTGFLMIFYPAISRRLQRKRFMDVMMLVGTLGYILMLICFVMKKGTAFPFGYDVKFLVLTVGYMLANFGQYGFYLIMMISVMNTVEYNEYKRGTRDEGIITSLRPFITKLASALNVAIAYLAYILFNTLHFTNGISDLEMQCNEQLITEASKNQQIAALLQDVMPYQSGGLLLVMTVLPFLLMLVSYLLYKKHYKLDELEYERICEELENRKKAVEA